MSETISDLIRQEARRTVLAILAHVDFFEGAPDLERIMEDKIARALMAERERAAREGYRVCAETRHVTLGKAVEAAIRGDHTAAMEAAAPGYAERRRALKER